MTVSTHAAYHCSRKHSISSDLGSGSRIMDKVRIRREDTEELLLHVVTSIHIDCCRHLDLIHYNRKLLDSTETSSHVCCI